MDKLTHHWTSRTTEDFLYSIASGFIRQIEATLERIGATQAQLAKQLRLSQGRVSQIFNNPGNLTLKKMIEYSSAIGRKVAVISYDDDDPDNTKGPIPAEIFVHCWEMAGKPADFFALHMAEPVAANAFDMVSIDYAFHHAASTTAVTTKRIGPPSSIGPNTIGTISN